jgi:hypothetical protein
MGRVSPWHSIHGTDEGTQTPTATPEGGRLHNPLCTWSSPSWGLHQTGSVEPTRAPPHGRASQGEEERYSGYFSCFVTSTIILASLHAPYYQGAQALRKRCPALR